MRPSPQQRVGGPVARSGREATGRDPVERRRHRRRLYPPRYSATSIRSAGNFGSANIEGEQQDEREAGSPPGGDEFWTFVEDPELRAALLTGVPGEPLNNVASRFDPPGADRSPFRNVGKRGYEADTRQLAWLHDDLERDAAEHREAYS